MRIKVYVLELTPRGKRNLVLGAALAIVAASALPADATVPNTFNTNDVLSASQMNANFASLDTRVGAIEKHPVVTINGKKYSIGAAYCGVTAATNGNITNGYAGAKSQCEGVSAGCNSSPSAHMCSAEEIVRSFEVGISVGQGWYSDASAASYDVADMMDCYGWTSSAPGLYANVIVLGQVNHTPCNTTDPILCCD